MGHLADKIKTDGMVRRYAERAEAEEDHCLSVLAEQATAERCRTEADALPDGSGEQIATLLRGMLAAQLATTDMLMMIIDRHDWWPQTHGDWHAQNPGAYCPDSPGCGYDSGPRPSR